MQHRWSPLLVAVAAALAVGLAACGDDGPESAPTTEAPGVTTSESSVPAAGASEAGDVTLDSGPSVEDAADALVGLSEEDVEAAAAQHGWTVRVVRRDGEDLAATMDLQPDRVNVEVTDGEVTAVLSVG